MIMTMRDVMENEQDEEIALLSTDSPGGQVIVTKVSNGKFLFLSTIKAFSCTGFCPTSTRNLLVKNEVR